MCIFCFILGHEVHNEFKPFTTELQLRLQKVRSLFLFFLVIFKMFDVIWSLQTFEFGGWGAHLEWLSTGRVKILNLSFRDVFGVSQNQWKRVIIVYGRNGVYLASMSLKMDPELSPRTSCCSWICVIFCNWCYLKNQQFQCRENFKTAHEQAEQLMNRMLEVRGTVIT